MKLSTAGKVFLGEKFSTLCRGNINLSPRGSTEELQDFTAAEIMNTQICRELDQISPFILNTLTNISLFAVYYQAYAAVIHDCHSFSHWHSEHSTWSRRAGTGRTTRHRQEQLAALFTLDFSSSYDFQQWNYFISLNHWFPHSTRTHWHKEQLTTTANSTQQFSTANMLFMCLVSGRILYPEYCIY